MSSDAVKNNADTVDGAIGFDPSFDVKTDQAVAFARAYATRYGEDLKFPLEQANAYSLVYLLKDFYEQTKGKEGMIMDRLVGLRNWTGGSLKDISLDAFGDIDWKTYKVNEVKDGTVREVKEFSL